MRLRFFIFIAVLVFLVSERSWALREPKNYRLGFGLGYQSLEYNEVHENQPQKGIDHLKETALTARLDFLYYFVPGVFDFALEADGTTRILASNYPDRSAYFLNYNGRVGWILPFIPKPYMISLMVGGFFTTMFVKGVPRYGYQNQRGPEFYPVFRYLSETRSSTNYSLDAYFKYSPLTDGSVPISGLNRVIGAGASLRFPVAGKFQFPEYSVQKALTFRVDYQDLSFKFYSVRMVTVSSKTINLSIGYDW